MNCYLYKATLLEASKHCYTPLHYILQKLLLAYRVIFAVCFSLPFALLVLKASRIQNHGPEDLQG